MCCYPWWYIGTKRLLNESEGTRIIRLNSERAAQDAAAQQHAEQRPPTAFDHPLPARMSVRDTGRST